MAKVDLEKLKRTVDELEKERKEKKAKTNTPQTIGKCVVCGGNIKQKLKFNYSRGENFIGNQQIISYVDGAYCVKCGLFYNHLVVEKNNEKPRDK